MELDIEAQWTTDKLIAFLRSQAADIGEGISTDELMTATGMSQAWANKQLRMLYQQGKLDVSWREAERRDGKPYRMPVYRLKDDAKSV